jgi:hypothetical protein
VDHAAIRFTVGAGQMAAVGLVSNRSFNGQDWYVCLVTVTQG